MYGMSCSNKKSCQRPSCLFPSPCKFLKADYTQLLKLMKAILKWSRSDGRKINVYVASGVRHDLALLSDEYIELLASHFTGGHLKVAPEHSCPSVLALMGKPPLEQFDKFEEKFKAASKKAGKQQYLVPYFISSHPGCTDDDAVQLLEYLVSKNWKLEQVQDFTPVPLTLSTAMYVSGLDSKGEKIFVPKGHSEKKLQLSLLQYHIPSNYRQLINFLTSKGKKGLIEKLKNMRKW
jgi:uncharacterized radical SAM protein YgiQ